MRSFSLSQSSGGVGPRQQHRVPAAGTNWPRACRWAGAREAFGANINDKTFRDAIDAVTAKVWDVGGAKASLFEVGYTRVGIDEAGELQRHRPGPRAAPALADGTPMINVDKFPT